MFSFWSFFLKNKRFSQLILIALIGAGLVSLFSIPKESNPEVEVPIGVVSTFLPGGSAEDVETLITNEIESGLQNLDEVKKITSTSASRISSIVVEFDASANIDKAIQDLKDAVDTVAPNLPSEAEDPVVAQVDFSAEPIMIISVATDRPAPEVVSLAQTIERELKRIPGVSDVTPQGLREREVQVIVNQERLQAFGLSTDTVVRALSGTNSSLPVGTIKTNGIVYPVSFNGDIKDPNEIPDIAIANNNGFPIYIRDIADVSIGVEEASTISRISLEVNPSENAISFSVFKQTGGNIIETTQAVRDKLEELQDGGVLSDSEVLVSFDVGEFIKQDLSNLTFTALQTVLLVMIILFLAVGLKEALLAGLAIPLSFLLSFIGLSASGNTVNFVSLFSLILAVGILVDSAIVIVEGMHANSIKRQNESMNVIAFQTLKEFYKPLFSGTMTTIAVFFPLFFISGITGEFIASIPFTMIFVLTASIVVALGFLPLIASSVLKSQSNKEETSLEEKRVRYSDIVEKWYQRKLNKILGNKKREKKVIKWSVIAFFIVFSFPIIGIVNVEFFPQEDLDFVFLEVEKERGTVIEDTDFVTRQVEEILYENENIESFVTTVGTGSAFAGTDFGGSSDNGNIANMTINLKKNRKDSSSEVSQQLREELALIKEADVRVVQTNNGPPTGAPVLITFFGDSLEELETLASQSEDILKNIEGTRDVSTSISDSGTEFLLSVDRSKATQLGLSPLSIAQTLRTAIVGTTATTIKTDTDDIDVVVKLNLNPNYQGPHDTNRTTIDSIRQISVTTPSGSVLLGSVLDTSLDRSSSSIRHEDTKRIASVSSQLQDGAVVGAIVSEFRAQIADGALVLPDTVEMRVGGETEDVDQSFKEMGLAFIAGLVLMLAILVLQFDSIRYALFILAIIPFSFIGIFIGLALTGKALSFPSLMGVIALSGILVNNSIILIDKMNSLREEYPMLAIRDVVVAASTSRLRPILLTTLTTVIGIFPLTYAAELWSPLAWSIIFGLTFSVVLTLVLVPILYDRWCKR